MQSLVGAIVDDPAIENVNALYAYCMSAPVEELHENSDLLHRMQYSIWDSGLNGASKVNGNTYSPSMMTLVLCALSVPPERLQDDARTLSDFPSVVIQKVWQHDARDCGEIRNMSLQLVCHTLQGVEWNIFSDLMFGLEKRTRRWMLEAFSLIEQLRKRVYYFIQGSSTREILNVPEYVTITKLVNPISRAETGDCDSDADIARMRKRRCGVDIAEEDIPVEAAVNTDFLFDMDTYFSTIFMRLSQHSAITNLSVPAELNLRTLRGWVLDEIKGVNSKYVTSTREDWHLGLICSDCYARIENRTSFLGMTGKKEILYKRNHDLSDAMPRKIAEMTTPAVLNRKENVRLNMDAMFVHLSVEADLLKAVYVKAIPDVPDEVCIFYMPIAAVWVCHISAEVAFSCTSFMHAFAVLRTHCRAQGISHMVRGLDISKFDAHI